MPYCDVKGVRTYYEVQGQGEPLLLIHGAGQDTLSWRYNIPSLAKKYKVWAIDLPGHGKSALVSKGPIDSLEEYANFTIDFIKINEIINPVIIGHSMAGGIGFYIALMCPENTRAVISVDGSAFTSGTYGDEVFDLVAINISEWFEINSRTICSLSTSEKIVEEIVFDINGCAPSVIFNDIRAFANYNLTDRLHEIQLPIFFIHGEDDWSITPEMSKKTQSMLNCKTEYRLSKNIGHFPHFENPELFNRDVFELLDTI